MSVFKTRDELLEDAKKQADELRAAYMEMPIEDVVDRLMVFELKRLRKNALNYFTNGKLRIVRDCKKLQYFRRAISQEGAGLTRALVCNWMKIRDEQPELWGKLSYSERRRVLRTFKRIPDEYKKKKGFEVKICED